MDYRRKYIDFLLGSWRKRVDKVMEARKESIRRLHKLGRKVKKKKAS